MLEIPAASIISVVAITLIFRFAVRLIRPTFAVQVTPHLSIALPSDTLG